MSEIQTWNSEQYVNNASFVSRLGMPLLDLLGAQPGERVLDLGCGEGTLMEELRARGVDVVGADASEALVKAARARGLEAHVMDAQALTFAKEFDHVFSNAALHWMPDIARVFAGVARALRTGGRFVAECGGAGNVEHVRAALIAELDRRGVDGQARDPWHFRSTDEYSAHLESAGFRVEQMVSFPRPTPLPGDVTEWIATMGKTFLHALPEVERPGYLRDVRARVRPALQDDAGTWVLDYVRVRFVATLV